MTDTGNIYKKIFLGISAFLLFLLPILSFDSGITDDDCIENEHGIRLMNYYLGTDTIAAASPFNKHGEWSLKDDNGDLILNTKPLEYAANKNIYGGFFDMVCAFAYKYVTCHIMGEYESRHFIGAISGVLLFVLIGLITGQLTGSWVAAILGLLFACLSPRLVGHSYNDPKEIPFAATFAFGLYQIILLLQEDLKVKWSRAFLLILAFIISIDTRVAGVMLIVYMIGFAVLWVIYQVLIQKESIRQYILPLLLILIIAVAGYLGASLCWPWASRNPVMNPIISLRIFSHLNQFNSYELFEGVRINNDQIPWYFAIKWFYITFPVYVFTGVILFLIMSVWHIRDQMKYLFPTLLVSATAIVPLVLVIMQKSNLYDDARHLYFVLPSIIVLAAIGWYWLMRQLPPIPLGPAAIICSLTMLEPFLFMVRNHPHEVMYFNPMIGGAKGAFKQYEMDYWGFSVKAAALWIDNTDSVQAKDRKTRVRLWYGEQRKLKYYTDKSKHLEYVSSATGSPDWDYWIELPAESKFDPGLLANWPPPNTIHEITVDGVPLCAIVRNPLSSLSGAYPANVASLMNPNDHMGRGLAYYNTKDYNKAIIEFKLVLATDSTDKIAYNNIVAAYNLLNMYKAAVDLGTKVMKKYPDFALLKNNLAVSQQGLKDLKPDEKYYAAISYNYFVQGDYQMSIYAAKEILKINPKSAAAYNNICAANNALGNYKAGKEACDKALILAPGDQLIKNNLAFSEKNLKAP